MSSKTLYIYNLDLAVNVGQKVTYPIEAAILQETTQTKMTLDNSGSVVELFTRSAYQRVVDLVPITFQDILDDSRYAGYGIYSTFTETVGADKYLYGNYKCPAYYLRWKFVQGTDVNYLHMIGTETLLTPWETRPDSENKDVLVIGAAVPVNAWAGAYKLTFSGIRINVEASTWISHGVYWPATNLAGFWNKPYWPEETY